MRKVMKLKEILEEEKKIMSPLRWKMNTIILPLYLSINLPPILIVIPLMIVDAGRYFPIFIAYMVMMALTTMGMIATIPWMNKKETEIELERFDYLFHSAKPIEGEKVQVVNVTNGERLETYAIPGRRDSGVICLNGAAAHKASVGDVVIIISYAQMDFEEAKTFAPHVVFPDTATNRIVE